MSDQWQEIDSAPRDGTTFQVWVKFDDETYGKGEAEHRGRFSHDGRYLEIWCENGLKELSWNHCPWMTPTHWRNSDE
jgi:hypothetical protein